MVVGGGTHGGGGGDGMRLEFWWRNMWGIGWGGGGGRK